MSFEEEHLEHHPRNQPAHHDHDPSKIERRTFLRWGALAAAGATLAGLAPTPSAEAAGLAAAPHDEMTIRAIQAAMATGQLTALELVEFYLDRINRLDKRGPKVNSVIEINPDARAIAKALDDERVHGHAREPLHGIPILLKDNIDTADRMQTTAGSIALIGHPPSQDATVARKLRDAGAVILGKTNLSEWANFRSTHSSSGWSGRGGQTRNPYVLDRNPCGSSSGSGAATAANFCAASLGTETDGSIVCPATANGVVGIKPTVGLVSRAGVIPISHSQDTVGPHGRTVADAAAVLGSLTGVDPRDPATAASAGKSFTDYTQFLDAHALKGARIGVARKGVSGYSEETDRVYEQAIKVLKDAGAIIVDPADIPTIDQINAGAEEIEVLLFEFKEDLNKYLATRRGVALDREGFPLTLAGLIAFNQKHADVELKWFLQELFELSEAKDIGPNSTDRQSYLTALAKARQLGGAQGIDATLKQFNLDAIIAPTGQPAWTTDLINGDHFLGASSSPAAIAGYPLVSVPAGYQFGLPVNITFMASAWSEPTLIKLAYAFEQASRVRVPPQFKPTIPYD